MVRGISGIHNKDRTKFYRKIGRYRVSKLAQEYEELGYLVIVREENQEGVDLLVITTPEGKVVKAIEITNYAKTSRMHDYKLLRYINYLNYFNRIRGIRKQLVVSFSENLNAKQLSELNENKIEVVEIGHQDIPPNIRSEEDLIEGWFE